MSALTPERKQEIITRMRQAHYLVAKRAEGAIGLTSYYALEGIDSKHRDKAILNAKYAQWLKLPDLEDNRSFWKWLETTDPSLATAQGVVYLDSKDRVQYKLRIEDGVIKQGDSELPYDTRAFKGKTRGFAAYVMDKKGDIYTLEHQTGVMHHSSLLAGKSVVSAGMMQVIDGKITYIDHRSGHYAPNKKDFENLLNRIDRRVLSETATISLSEGVKSTFVARIAHFFSTIQDNTYFNWLPTKWLGNLVKYGKHLETNNVKESEVSVQDYYKNALKEIRKDQDPKPASSLDAVDEPVQPSRDKKMGL